MNLELKYILKNKINLPFKLRSSNFPVGIKYVAGNSAQLKSAAILAALNSYGTSTVFEKSKHVTIQKIY